MCSSDLATASASNGTSPYTYSWSNGAVSAAITSLTAGTYTVTITDANGCTDAASVSITEPSALSATTTSTSNVSCNGASDGAIDISVSGGTTTYAYAWSNGATTEDLTGLSAGTYTVTVTDANGCTASLSETITQPTSVSATISGSSNPTCNGFADGSATSAASGGTSPYTYSWSNATTAANASNLAAGTYSVTITDANGCTDSASIILLQPAALIASAAVTNNPSCNGFADGSASSSASGGTLPYTYTWNTGATTANVSSLVAGAYSVTITDANGCTDSASVTLSQATSLVASVVVNNDPLCFGDFNGSATASASGGTAPYSYTWRDRKSVV